MDFGIDRALASLGAGCALVAAGAAALILLRMLGKLAWDGIAAEASVVGPWTRAGELPLLSLAGLTFVVVSASSATAFRGGSPTRRGVHMTESSRSRAGGPPPPQPPARDRGTFQPGHQGDALPPASPRVHPAIHGGAARNIKVEGPLFDRSGRRLSNERTLDTDRAAGRERAMRMHPAGRALPGRDLESRGGGGSAGARDGIVSRRDATVEREGPSRWPRMTVHVVREGESLWSIAEDVLETSDLRRVARYWPAIHRANRSVVGRDPNRIFPGQRLVLPPEDDA